MRQIKSFLNAILHQVKNCEFNVKKENVFNDRLSISRHTMNYSHTNMKSIFITHTNGNVMNFITNNLTNKEYVVVSVKVFGSKIHQNNQIDLTILDEADYFNYAVLYNPGQIAFEDISVLNEIKTLTLGLFTEQR